MEKQLVISGQNPLNGAIHIKSAKNSVLPLLAACVMTDAKITIKDCPRISDIDNMLVILSELGVDCAFKEGDIEICARGISAYEVDRVHALKMRSSIFLLGALLSRFKCAVISEPGGCNIGSRPIDQHIKGLTILGAKIIKRDDYIFCNGSSMRAGDIVLDMPSVGATENLIMAAVFLEGETIIRNAAREPEIVDLANFLNALGAKICGAGGSVIKIKGVRALDCQELEFTPIGDRIVAGTYLIAGAITRGNVRVDNVDPAHIEPLLSILSTGGCAVESGKDFARVSCERVFVNPLTVSTAPYPLFPTDLQSQLLALLSVGKGETSVYENLFESRFAHAVELNKMGARIVVQNNCAKVYGAQYLKGATVLSQDLRGGAALVLGALAAAGTVRINGVRHIERGYENIASDLNSLGANVKLIEI